MHLSITNKIVLSIIAILFISIGLSLFMHALSVAFMSALIVAGVFTAYQIFRSD